MYILKSSRDEDLYVGSTNDLRRRVREHNQGRSQSTSWRGPFELLYYEAYKNEKDAREREQKLKLRGQARRHFMSRIRRCLA